MEPASPQENTMHLGRMDEKTRPCTQFHADRILRPSKPGEGSNRMSNILGPISFPRPRLAGVIRTEPLPEGICVHSVAL